jgi:hypothetical protein
LREQCFSFFCPYCSSFDSCHTRLNIQK